MRLPFDIDGGDWGRSQRARGSERDSALDSPRSAALRGRRHPVEQGQRWLPEQLVRRFLPPQSLVSRVARGEAARRRSRPRPQLSGLFWWLALTLPPYTEL